MTSATENPHEKPLCATSHAPWDEAALPFRVSHIEDDMKALRHDFDSMKERLSRQENRVEGIEEGIRRYDELHESTNKVLRELQDTLKTITDVQNKQSEVLDQVKELLKVYNKAKATGDTLKNLGEAAQFLVKSAVAIGAIWLFIKVALNENPVAAVSGAPQKIEVPK